MSHFLNFWGAAVACAALWAGSAAAQAPLVSLEPVTVTATRLPAPAAEALQSMTTLERRDLNALVKTDALSALQGEAGFEHAQTGGLGTLGALFTRGTDSDQTLVLIDGIRVNAPTDGGSPLNHLLLDAAERIELVRGNVSGLYGSQAVGGVVQVFTRPEDTRGASASMALGSTPTAKWGLRFGNGSGATRYAVAANYLTTDGYSAVRAREIPSFTTRIEDLDDDAYYNATLRARIAHDFNAQHAVEASVLHTRARTEFDGSFENRTKSEISVWALNSVHAWSDRFLSRVTLGQADNQARNFLGSANTSRFDTRNQQLTLQNEFSPVAGQTLLAGIEWLRQEVDSTTVYDQDARRVVSPFLAYYAKRGAFSAQISARHDRYSDVDDATTGRVSLGYDVTPEFKLRASMATAFKAPSFDDLYFPLFGNPNLEPERSRSLEFGLRYAPDQASYFDAQFFRNRLHKLITFDAALGRPLNVERAKSDGVELTFARRAFGLQWRASMTVQDPRNLTTDQRLLRRAKLFGALGVQAPFERGSVRLQLRAAGAREDNSFDFTRRVRLGGYTVADLYGEYAISKQTRLQASIENLFDKDYELAHGYHVQPFTLSVQLSHRWP